MFQHNCLRQSDQNIFFWKVCAAYDGWLSWREGAMSNGKAAQSCGYQVNQMSEDRRFQNEWWENNPIIFLWEV